MKKILVINGHPNKESFNAVIAQSYIKSALEAGSEVRYIEIGALDFNPNLQFGYHQRMELEPDLVKALADIQWSEHQVWIHPLWWLGMPAIMKGFFDRAFLPGITFKSNKEGATEGLLQGRTGRIITTAGDLSLDIYEDIYASSGLVQLKRGILEYCGISSIQDSFIGPLYELNEHDRRKWIVQIEKFAIADSV
ncbi:NAD(P)H-dependent oxidoreductase [Pedobacter sp. WC2423]|uniref:NAD(P)H-dependent oxidoreductase n=1 Tax=Pedobacter sp. WC2423 TaxID=3234142 RepID=UPI003464FE2C